MKKYLDYLTICNLYSCYFSCYFKVSLICFSPVLNLCSIHSPIHLVAHKLFNLHNLHIIICIIHCLSYAVKIKKVVISNSKKKIFNTCV